MVVVWLHDPREQFWGELGSLNSAGIVMHGLSLASFEDSSRQHRNGEVTLPSALFFPMHRVERIEIDQRVGDIPSLLERFSNTTEESLRWLHSTKDGH